MQPTFKANFDTYLAELNDRWRCSVDPFARLFAVPRVGSQARVRNRIGHNTPAAIWFPASPDGNYRYSSDPRMVVFTLMVNQDVFADLWISPSTRTPDPIRLSPTSCFRRS